MIPVIKLYQLFPGLLEWGMARAIPNSRKDKNRDGSDGKSKEK